MKKLLNPLKRNQGISLIEAMISTLILAAGVLAFAQSHSNQVASGLDNLERQQAALIASDINNMIAAHVNLQGTASSASTIKTKVNRLILEIRNAANQMAADRGYRCKNNTPIISGTAAPQSSPTKSTALLPWMTGPAFCISIQIPAGQVLNSNVNGTWVQTTIYWQPLKRADNSTDSISISTLMLPM